MSAALRFASFGLPLVAAAVMAGTAHAATACLVAGASVWENSREAHARILAFGENCPRECPSAEQAKVHEPPQLYTPAPLPLTLVARAEDIADWHARIFARLASDRDGDAATRYCALPAAPRTAHSQLGSRVPRAPGRS
jgi:hypothetical protein